MAEKKKRVTITSPKGTFIYPKLTKADYGNAEYPNPDGSYSVQLSMQADDPITKVFLKKLEALHAEAMAEAEVEFKKLKVETRKKLGKVNVQPLYTTVYDQETEEPTGEIRFKIAMKASGTRRSDDSKWTAKPAIFDAKGRPMVKVPDIWSGTEGKVSFSPSAYFIPGTALAGLKLHLNAVQIIDLVSNGSRSASSYGFGTEEGYEYEPNEFAPENEDDGEEAEDTTTSTAIDDEIPF